MTMKEVIIMKNINDNMKTINTMIKNFNDARIFDELVRRTTTFYGRNNEPVKPNYWFTDDGERICIEDAVDIKHNEKSYYIDVQCDACYLYIANKEKSRFDFVSCFSYDDYKNITSLQLSIATRILTD